MYLAVDIGGTKTLVALFSSDGEVVKQLRFPTPHDYQLFLQDLSAHVSDLGAHRVEYCCVAVPGLLDREQGMVIALGNLPWRNDYIRDDVARVLGVPTTIENDAKTAGLSEAILLKNEYQDVLYATISTGIGGALLRDGEIVPSLQDMELGKIPLQHGGKIVHWEDFAGGRSIVSHFNKRASEITDPKDWAYIGTNIAYGLGIACSILQPDVIVLDGGVGQFAEKFRSVIMEYLDQHLHDNVRQPEAVLTARRPNVAVIHGCYELAKRAHATTTAAQ